MVDIASLAKSVMATHVGFGVIIVEMLVEALSTCFATTPSEYDVGISDDTRECTRLVYNQRRITAFVRQHICATLSTVSPADDLTGFFSHNFETGLSSESSIKGFRCGS